MVNEKLLISWNICFKIYIKFYITINEFAKKKVKSKTQSGTQSQLDLIDLLETTTRRYAMWIFNSIMHSIEVNGFSFVNQTSNWFIETHIFRQIPTKPSESTLWAMENCRFALRKSWTTTSMDLDFVVARRLFSCCWWWWYRALSSRRDDCYPLIRLMDFRWRLRIWVVLCCVVVFLFKPFGTLSFLILRPTFHFALN